MLWFGAVLGSFGLEIGKNIDNIRILKRISWY